MDTFYNSVSYLYDELMMTCHMLIPFRSVCVERVRGKESSTGGVGQLFLQQLRQRWGGKQERGCSQSVSHHGDRDHGGWQGDHSAHRGRQKWAGGLQQVHALTVKWRDSVSCIPAVSVSAEPFPLQTCSHTIWLPLPLFFFWYSHHPVCSLLSYLTLTSEYSDQQSDGMLFLRSSDLECGFKVRTDVPCLVSFACCIEQNVM